MTVRDVVAAGRIMLVAVAFLFVLAGIASLFVENFTNAVAAFAVAILCGWGAR